MASADDSSVIRVLCVDDHPLVRKGIASILANEKDVRLVAEAGDGRDAVALFREHRPDVTLMDLRMPGMDGMTAVALIRREFPEAKIIALTSYDGDQEIQRALEAGVRGYLLKEMVHTEVLRAIRIVHAGQRLMPAQVVEKLAEYFPPVALTAREVEVLSYVAKGQSNREISAQIGTARNRENSCAEYSGQAGRCGSNACGYDCDVCKRGILHLDA